MTRRYLWLDLSLMFNVAEGVGEVATRVKDDNKIACLFNWHFVDIPSPPGLPYPHADKIIYLPYGEWWLDLYRKGDEYNMRYKAWVES